MQAADLKNPGINLLHQTTRVNVAASISALESETNPSGEFAAFLADAAAKTPGYAGPALPATQAVVADAQVITLDGKTYTFTVAGGAITAIVVADA